jgi:hypothetical protein
LTGKKFARLFVLKYIRQDKNGGSLWLCKCKCDKEIIVRGSSLRNGHTKSCGCLHNDLLSKRVSKHNHTKNRKRSKIYSTWTQMIQRCTNPNDKAYKNYGGRTPPITVCRRWSNKKNGFQNFYKDVGDPPEGLTLDRINNNNGYKPNNCRWATRKEQSRNMRNNKLYYYNNKEQCLSAWAEEYRINRRTLTNRLNGGLSIEQALMLPIRKYERGK